jgi:hypothetical protein
MLRQEQAADTPRGYTSTSPPPQTPDQTRVTTDELIGAVAEIEARRDASQRWHADTISLGDAVRQLGLNITPGELLDEIEANRARRFAEAQNHARAAARRKSMRGAWVAIGASILVALMLLGFLFTSAEPNMSPPTPVMASVAPMITGEGTTAPAGPSFQALPEGGTGYVTLQTAYAANHGLGAGQMEVTGAQEFYDTNLNFYRQLWAVTKINGKPYLQGWGTRDSEGLIRSMSSSPLSDAPGQTTVTIPLEDLGGIKDPSKIVREQNAAYQTKAIEVINFTKEQARKLHLNESH